MESSKISALLLISMLFVSSVTPILGCNTCPKPPKKGGGGIKPPVKLPPVKLPPIKLPPVKLPPVPVVGGGLPPVVGGGLPPVVGGVLPPVVGGGLPPVVGGGLPPVVGGGLPPVVGGVLPPVVGGGLPPVGGVVPPVLGGGTPNKPCPTPPSTKTPPPKTKPEKCPIDILKLGACVDLLGGLVHIGLGDPKVNKCCPLLKGLAEIEAAACLCTTLKVKLLNLKIYVPLALQLLLTCGKSPPPGYTCSI
ncbi:hypothetical protein ACHQM5_029009 [Ranunculus cassubicifolius]